MSSPPDAINNLLARRTLDETPRLTQNGHLYRVADAFLQIIVMFFTRPLKEPGWGTGIDWPTRGEDEGELKHVGRVFAQCAYSKNLAEVGSSPGKSGGGQVAVTDEVDAIEEKTEDNCEIPFALDVEIFLF